MAIQHHVATGLCRLMQRQSASAIYPGSPLAAPQVHFWQYVYRVFYYHATQHRLINSCDWDFVLSLGG